MWKPVQLQGWGEGSTTINAIKAPADKLQTWREFVDGLIATGVIDLLPGQEVGPAPPSQPTLSPKRAPASWCLPKQRGTRHSTTWQWQQPAEQQECRIDGFTIKSADTGGGIIANGYAKYLQISNNRIANNSGFYGGGIRVGHPLLTDPDELAYIDADNDFVKVHHNQVVFNGGLGGAGGGISMCTGSDSYAVTQNWVCGNFATADGGGIGHIGLSRRVPGQGNQPAGPVPLIADNTVIFNESFLQGQTVSGGGIFIGGAPPLTAGGLTPGAGNVQVLRNLIQGNSAGAGDGGGIRLAGVNGQDVAANPNNTPPNNQNQPPQWYSVDVFNNMIVNNVAGLAGGGISLQDAVAVRIGTTRSPTTTAWRLRVRPSHPGSPDQSTPQPGAGIVTRAHSAALAAASGQCRDVLRPEDVRQQHHLAEPPVLLLGGCDSGCTPGDPGCTSTYGLCPDVSGGLACPGGNTVVYDDLAVIGTAGILDVQPVTSCIRGRALRSEPAVRLRVLQRRPLSRVPTRGHHRHPDAGGLRRGRQLHPARLRAAVAVLTT